MVTGKCYGWYRIVFEFNRLHATLKLSVPDACAQFLFWFCIKMAKDDDGDWKSCVKAILSASQTSYSTSNIPNLVTLITKRYDLGSVLFCWCNMHCRSFSLAGIRFCNQSDQVYLFYCNRKDVLLTKVLFLYACLFREQEILHHDDDLESFYSSFVALATHYICVGIGSCMYNVYFINYFFGTVILVMWRSTFENNDCALIIVCKTCSYLIVWDLYVVMTCSGAHLVRMSFIFQNVASMSSVLLLHCTLLNVAVSFNSCSEQNEHQWGCIGLQCRITVSAGTPSPAAWELHDHKGRTDVTNCEFDDIVSVVCTYITVLNDNDKQLSMSNLSNMLLWQ